VHLYHHHSDCRGRPETQSDDEDNKKGNVANKTPNFGKRSIERDKTWHAMFVSSIGRRFNTLIKYARMQEVELLMTS